MNKFRKGDRLVVLKSSDRNNVGRVGALIAAAIDRLQDEQV